MPEPVRILIVDDDRGNALLAKEAIGGYFELFRRYSWRRRRMYAVAEPEGLRRHIAGSKPSSPLSALLRFDFGFSVRSLL